MMRRLAVLLGLLLACSGSAGATNVARYAVVIGNGNYDALPSLDNALKDAALVAATLAEDGYRVVHERDLTGAQFGQLLDRLAREVPAGATVVFFYAGHGVQVGNENFLVPVDSELADIFALRVEAVSLHSVVETVGARAGTQVFLLDSCRNNPFVGAPVQVGLDTGQDSIGIGFSFLQAPINTLISFATAPGTFAYDGIGDHSPYTAALVERARAAPGEEFVTVLSRTRRDVFESTRGGQVPWESSSLVEMFTLIAGDAAPVVTGAGPPVAAALPSAGRSLPLPATVTHAARYEAQVELGASLPATGSVSAVLTAPPASGYLTLPDSGGGVLRPGQSFDAALLPGLRYHPEPLAADAAAPELVVDRFQLALDGVALPVEVRLALDPCDLQAGGLFDPQGVTPGVDNFALRPQQALAACRSAVAAAPENARLRYQLSRALKANRMFDDSDAELERARAAGHLRAVTGTAAAIIEKRAVAAGFSPSRAPEAALELLRTAHAGGDPLASYVLGRQYLRYGLNEAEREAGYEMLMRAKDRGFAEALTELGSFYLETEGALRDPQRGLVYLEEAAERGSVSGRFSLGSVLGLGLSGIAVDRPRAIDLLRQASQAGHGVAARNLGRVLAQADASPPERAEALRMFELALTRGDGWSGVLAARQLLGTAASAAGRFDAARLAASAAVLANPAPAAEAEKILADMTPRDLDGGTQALLAALGHDLRVDGSFGAQSQRALQGALADPAVPAGLSQELTTPIGRLRTAARLLWLRSELRPELM